MKGAQQLSTRTYVLPGQACLARVNDAHETCQERQAGTEIATFQRQCCREVSEAKKNHGQAFRLSPAHKPLHRQLVAARLQEDKQLCIKAEQLQRARRTEGTVVQLATEHRCCSCSDNEKSRDKMEKVAQRV